MALMRMAGAIWIYHGGYKGGKCI